MEKQKRTPRQPGPPFTAVVLPPPATNPVMQKARLGAEKPEAHDSVKARGACRKDVPTPMVKAGPLAPPEPDAGVPESKEFAKMGVGKVSGEGVAEGEGVAVVVEAPDVEDEGVGLAVTVGEKEGVALGVGEGRGHRRVLPVSTVRAPACRRYTPPPAASG